MDSKQLALLAPKNCPFELPAESIRVLGIDLGTTNSTVAEVVWDAAKRDVSVRCLEVEQDTLFGLYTHVLVPSAVAIHDGKVIVGEGAKRLLARAAELGLEREKTLFLECKNDMGVQRTYHRAPAGFRSAPEIGGKVLSFLRVAAISQNATPPKRMVVTVPASFQAAQRLDTAKAAALAGITISGGDLLDEPVAAFLDYLMTHPDEFSGGLTAPRKLVVFDFGGGTCDVAVFLLKRSPAGNLEISPLAVSRYHRLGGGDIDRAILYEALLPQLLEQNNLKPFDLTFEDKKTFIEAAYLGVAEALKTGLCSEISRLADFGKYDEADKAKVTKVQPGLHTCRLGERTLNLQSPSLSATQFETILQPFLDQSLLFARETEYRLTCSVFAPLRDALDNCALDAGDIDLCLMVGGSSLIPQVARAVGGYFKNARMVTYDDRESVQLAVARGAAWHSLSLALFGRGLFDVVIQDRISISTKTGSLELIPKGAALPYPADDGWAETLALAVPDSSFPEPVKLLVKILAGASGQERTLYESDWRISAPVAEGDRLRLQYRINENQVFEFRLTVADDPKGTPFEQSIQNPLSNVVNPHATRLKIQQAEEELRTGKIPAPQRPGKIVAIARDYVELDQTEKAISYLERALRMKNQPDPDILNLMAIYFGGLGNTDKEERLFLECARLTRGNAPLFNLALSQNKQHRLPAAAQTIESCLERHRDGPTLALKAMIADSMKHAGERDAALREAMGLFGGTRSMSDWELGWLATAAGMVGDKVRLEEASAEQKRRKAFTGQVTPTVGQLPMISAEDGRK